MVREHCPCRVFEIPEWQDEHENWAMYLLSSEHNELLSETFRGVVRQWFPRVTTHIIRHKGIRSYDSYTDIFGEELIASIGTPNGSRAMQVIARQPFSDLMDDIMQEDVEFADLTRYQAEWLIEIVKHNPHLLGRILTDIGYEYPDLVSHWKPESCSTMSEYLLMDYPDQEYINIALYLPQDCNINIYRDDILFSHFKYFACRRNGLGVSSIIATKRVQPQWLPYLGSGRTWITDIITPIRSVWLRRGTIQLRPGHGNS